MSIAITRPIRHDVFDTNVVIVAGKGGVGKTTVSAVLAHAAADSGRRVLARRARRQTGAGRARAGSRGPLDRRQRRARRVPHEHGFTRVAKRLATSGVIDVVGTAAPGIDDLVVLGKIKQLERSQGNGT